MENVAERSKLAFNKKQTINFDVEFDFTSVMMYPPYVSFLQEILEEQWNNMV